MDKGGTTSQPGRWSNGKGQGEAQAAAEVQVARAIGSTQPAHRPEAAESPGGRGLNGPDSGAARQEEGPRGGPLQPTRRRDRGGAAAAACGESGEAPQGEGVLVVRGRGPSGGGRGQGSPRGAPSCGRGGRTAGEADKAGEPRRRAGAPGRQGKGHGGARPRPEGEVRAAETAAAAPVGPAVRATDRGRAGSSDQRAHEQPEQGRDEQAADNTYAAWPTAHGAAARRAAASDGRGAEGQRGATQPGGGGGKSKSWNEDSSDEVGGSSFAAPSGRGGGNGRNWRHLGVAAPRGQPGGECGRAGKLVDAGAARHQGPSDGAGGPPAPVAGGSVMAHQDFVDESAAMRQRLWSKQKGENQRPHRAARKRSHNGFHEQAEQPGECAAKGCAPGTSADAEATRLLARAMKAAKGWV